VLRETRVPLLVVHATSAATAPSVFTTAMLMDAGDGEPSPRAAALVAAMARAFDGTVLHAAADDVRRARASLGATWVAVPAPTPRTGHWLSHVGEPLVKSCTMPVLFIPEAEEGLIS
jgi:hypothetical protein